MNIKKIKLITTLITIFILLILLFVIVIFFKKNISDNYDLSKLKLFSLDKKGLNEILFRSQSVNYVLLGESSHGTADYYYWRSEITKKLIQQNKFNFIVVEGDWDSLYKVNEYVKHLTKENESGREILLSFKRWPTWMWANEEFLELVEWLRKYNEFLPLNERIGVYGNDIYGIDSSINQVLAYLEKISPIFHQEAQKNYKCIQKYDDYQSYVIDYVNNNESCEKEIDNVVNLLKNNSVYFLDINSDINSFFNAKQNALVVKYGELYYRSSINQGVTSWNNRVNYMKKTINRLTDFYGDNSKGIIWAHNTHVGDARATDMADFGMLNIGQLLRQKYGEDNLYIVGFGTNKGSVIASKNWEGKMEIMEIPEAKINSIEHYLSNLKLDSFILFMNEEFLPERIKEKQGHRAKGVVYNPENELNNYVKTLLPKRYNAFIFINETKPLTPLIKQ